MVISKPGQCGIVALRQGIADYTPGLKRKQYPPYIIAVVIPESSKGNVKIILSTEEANGLKFVDEP